MIKALPETFCEMESPARRTPLRNEFERADPVFRLGAWSISDKCSQTAFHACDVVLASIRSSSPRKNEKTGRKLSYIYLVIS